MIAYSNRIYKLDTMELVETLTYHRDSIVGMNSLSDTSKKFITASRENKLCLWTRQD